MIFRHLCRWDPIRALPVQFGAENQTEDNETKKKDDLKKLKYEMAICDESHYLKSHSTKRTKGLTPVLKKMKHVILLTGTPALNRPCELYPQAHIIQPQFFKRWKTYTRGVLAL